jgi:hypothetical protein
MNPMWKPKFLRARTGQPGRQRPSRRVALVELTGLELLDHRILPSVEPRSLLRTPR